jgi:hypothetical protein
MPRRLEAAYRATDYVIEAPGGAFVLQVDEPSDELAALQRARGVRESAFISAWNPRSETTDAATNAAAHQRLLEALRAAGYETLEGWGRNPAGAWPAERSVLVLGLDEEHARRLAAAFEQNALLHVGADATPRLVWVSTTA